MPPKRRLVEASAWVKRSKSFGMLAESMPTPSSLTAQTSRHGLHHIAPAFRQLDHDRPLAAGRQAGCHLLRKSVEAKE